MTSRRGAAIHLAILVLAPWSSARLACAGTLRRQLEASRISSTGLPASELDQPITSHAVLNESQLFLIAYYVDAGDGALPKELRLRLYNKDKDQWFRKTLDYRTLIPNHPHFSTGSVTGISRSNNFFYLNTHINPSAGYTLVVSRGLEFRKALYGWPLALFENETLVFHNSQIHFAPTHSAEISLYDPDAGRERKIYPLKPYQAIRVRHIERVREAYRRRGREWFAHNNHHMDPELFNNHLLGDVVVSDQTNSLAFLIGYQNTDFWSDDDKLKRESFRESARDVLEVVYVYRNVVPGTKLEYREILLEDLKNKHGVGSLRECLRPELLARIFE